MNTIIKQIDHILIRTEDPAPLYALLSETFQLPTVWPLATFGGRAFTTGGLCAGNVNLEVLRLDSLPIRTANTHFLGIAFEPTRLDASLIELDRRDLEYDEPAPYYETRPDGEKHLRWTNVQLEAFLPGSMIFLCQYNLDIEARRARGRTELDARSGGPLGLVGVREVIVATQAMDTTVTRWDQLLAPIPSPEMRLWKPENGPAIRLVQGADDQIIALVWEVASLTDARAFLDKNYLLGDGSDGHLTIDPVKVEGLDIRLVEARM
jgi:hypothetical protein